MRDSYATLAEILADEAVCNAAFSTELTRLIAEQPAAFEVDDLDTLADDDEPAEPSPYGYNDWLTDLQLAVNFDDADAQARVDAYVSTLRQPRPAAPALIAPPPGAGGWALRALTLCNLPYRDPVADFWSRTNGRQTLTVQSGRDTENRAFGVPYGLYPRLALLYVVTFAREHKTQEIPLGASLNRFLGTVGIGTGGRQRAAFLEQALRLFNAKILWQEAAPPGVRGQCAQAVDVGTRWRVWWNDRDAAGALVAPNSLTITDELYRDVTGDGVIPWSRDAVQSVGSSALALDLTLFLSWRLNADADVIRLPWRDLHQQFGSGSNSRDFGREVRRLLPRVARAVPTLGYTVRDGGVEIFRRPHGWSVPE